MEDVQSAGIKFEVLGPLRAWRDGVALPLGPVQQRVVLAVLLLHANRPIGRQQLIDAVWGTAHPTHAVNLLQRHISSLRRVLEPQRSARAASDRVVWTDGGYLLTVASGNLDLEQFDSSVSLARAARAARDLPKAAAALHSALELWRGPACDGLISPYLDAQREQLAERRISALEERIDLDLALGNHLDVIAELRALVADYPLRERLRGLLMAALYRSGRQADALTAYQDARRQLRDEVGLPPGDALQRLQQQILTADPDLGPPLPMAERTQRAVELGIRAGGRVDMSGWGISYITEDILYQIGNATSLNLADNNLRRLPPEIGMLTKLHTLDLSGNDLTDIPLELAKLRLTHLDVSSNSLENLPAVITKLQHLEYLDISDNPVTGVPHLACINSLRHFDASNTALIEVPSVIFHMRALSYLNLSSNKLESIPKHPNELRYLDKLEVLDLSDNNLRFFNAVLPAGLREINLARNSLVSFPTLSFKDTALEIIDVRSNQLRTIPAYLADLPSSVLLKLDFNDWTEPYKTLIDRGPEALITYLSSLGSSREMYEAKLLLVGEGEVGKSSLLTALRGDPFVQGRSTTHGIEVSHLTVQGPNKEQFITLNTWDFGGQEVYRITHQFFFSARAIYLIVWKPRIGQEESAIEQWCRRIQLRVGNDATVIIVATHGDERRPELDYQRLRNRFSEVVVGNYVIDSESGSNIKELATALGSAASQLPQMGELVSEKWVAIREILSGYEQPFMSRLKFERICQEKGLSEQDAETLANFLHDIGQIIYYGTDEGLRDLLILQPEWLTKAIGFILEDRKTRDSGGVVEHTRLASIWGGGNEASYPAAFYPYFLRLMEKFDVSYRLPGSEASLVAQLVPYERPDFNGTFEISNPRELRIICRTSDFPLGLIAWLTVRNHRYAVGHHWRRGVHLEDRTHFGRALYELEDDERTVTLTVQAPAPQYFFDILRSSMEHLIQDRWPGMKYSLLVPCRNKDLENSGCTGYFSLASLEKFHLRGEKRIICANCAEWSDVALLLTGFETDTDSLGTVIDRLTTIERVVKRVEISTSETARYMRSALKILGSEVDDCPRLFTVTKHPRYKSSTALSVKSAHNLRLWCEEPRAEHPTPDASYKFKVDKNWFTTVGPYLRTVSRILQVVLPITASVTEMAFGKELSDLAKADLDATLLIAEMIETEVGSDAGYIGEEEGKLARAEGAGLRALRQLLVKLDPLGRYGGMRKVQSPSGDFYWVCSTHYHRYDPGLPVIAGSPVGLT